MTYSLTYNTIDMGDFGLVINKRVQPLVHQNNSIQLVSRGYGLNSIQLAGLITLDVSIIGDGTTDLQDDLDSIKAALTYGGDRALKVDWYTDRYWMARFASMNVSLASPTTMAGQLVFDVFDPIAYDNDETVLPYTINDDPEVLAPNVGGTTTTYPVYTFTSGGANAAVTIENITTGEMIEWTGSLVINDILVFDTAEQSVRLNGVRSETTLDGSFPTLLPGVNDVEISDFSGTLTITYRARYA